MSKNQKQSSPSVAALAAKTMRDSNASNIERSLAASVVAQTNTGRQTGAAMEERAGKALANDRSSETTRRLAASVVSQANKSR